LQTNLPAWQPRLTGPSPPGLSGCSIEDFTRDPEAPINELTLATEPIATVRG